MSSEATTGVTGPVLAFDTSSSLGSVALAAGGRVLGRVFLEHSRRHAAELLPAIDEVLKAAGLGPGDLAGLVVGSGPGSFTGVRVAGATAKGLGHASGLPVWAYSSLAAAAASLGSRLPTGWVGTAGGPPERHLATPGPGTPCYVLFDARSDRVYGGCYRVDRMQVDTLVPPFASRVDDILGGHVPNGTVFAGDGALRHAWAIEQRGFSVAGPPAGVPTAEGLVRLLALSPRAPVEDLRGWEPEYLRPWSGGRGT